MTQNNLEIAKRLRFELLDQLKKIQMDEDPENIYETYKNKEGYNPENLTEIEVLELNRYDKTITSLVKNYKDLYREEKSQKAYEIASCLRQELIEKIKGVNSNNNVLSFIEEYSKKEGYHPGSLLIKKHKSVLKIYDSEIDIAKKLALLSQQNQKNQLELNPLVQKANQEQHRAEQMLSQLKSQLNGQPNKVFPTRAKMTQQTEQPQQELEQEQLRKNQEVRKHRIDQLSQFLKHKNNVENVSKNMFTKSSNWQEKSAAKQTLKMLQELDVIVERYLSNQTALDPLKLEAAALIKDTFKNIGQIGVLGTALANLLFCIVTLGGGLIYRAYTGSWFFKQKPLPEKVQELQTQCDDLANSI